VVYTGTHDNSSSRGWFDAATSLERKNLENYLGFAVNSDAAADCLLRLALESASSLAVLPMQDILGLDGQSRMNTPSSPYGNWQWRLTDQEGWAIPEASRPVGEGLKDAPPPPVFRRVRFLCSIYGRLPESRED
jgi:4-alpha-glucanotransferase